MPTTSPVGGGAPAAGRGEAVDVAHGPGAARRPDRGPVAEPLPAAQVRAAREPAALLVVLLERRAPVVQPEPATLGVGHGGREARGEAIPTLARGEHATAPRPAKSVRALGETRLRAGKTRRERVLARMEAAEVVRHRSVRDEHEPPAANASQPR